MRKIYSIALGIILITGFTISLLLAQADNMILSNKDIFVKKQRSAVAFPHDTHMEFDCKDCHHDYDNGKNVLDEGELEEGNDSIKCSTCHEKKKSGKILGLMDAYHIQCMGCHRKLAKEKKKTGPRLCGQCHPRK